MKAIVSIIALFFAMCALLIAIPHWLERARQDDVSPRPARPKAYSRTLAEDVVVNQYGFFNIDFVRCKRVSLEKKRQGPLTFGGLNVLVVEDLRLVVPPADKTVKDDTPGQGHEVGAGEIADRLGIDKDFLVQRSLPAKFSGLRIEGLEVSRLEGTNVVSVFRAEAGEAEKDGLHLRKCVIMRNYEVLVDKAVLSVKPRVRLVWDGGELPID